MLNIRGHSYRMRGYHADLRYDRLRGAISREQKGTYDRVIMGKLPWLLVVLSAVVLAGVIALWTREVFGWWHWRMREYDWWGRRKK